MHRLAIYDMDKTITRSPTWTPFLRAWARARPWRFAALAATVAPVALYLGKRIDRARLKEMTQRLVMGRRAARNSVERVAERFAARIVAGKVWDDARAQIAADRAAGYRVVMATASYDFYVRPIAAQLGITDVIATPSTVEKGRLVPRIAGENCYGDAKLRMIEAWLAGEGIARGDAQVRFYSDHVSDAPTLAWADEAFAVNPHAPLLALAEEKSWAVLRWR
ncbi:MAG: HAD family hydrolase [Sphingomonas sp.]|uniref:HAD family hydrolase n=1 Tax=Sphingomonas sp. TaxID=28214 RepID=UPI003F7DA3C2